MSYNYHGYASVRGSRPGAINNSSLFVENFSSALPASREMREFLLDNSDYHLLSAPVWTKLMQWYGITHEWQVLITP